MWRGDMSTETLMTLGKSRTLSKPRYPYLEDGETISTLQVYMTIQYQRVKNLKIYYVRQGVRCGGSKSELQRKMSAFTELPFKR